MTIPRELAALQRYSYGDEYGHFEDYIKASDVAEMVRAWPQRASGEAKPVAFRPIYSDGTLGNWSNEFDEIDGEVEYAYSHPAATSAQVAIYFCSGPSGSIWALDESEIEPTIKQFAEAHGDDPGEYTATPFYSKPADTSALLERIAKLEADNLELREISCKNYSGAMLVTNERDACMKTIAKQRDYIHSREELIEEYANEMLNLIAATARVKKKFIKTLWCLATEKGGEISFSYSTFTAMRDDAAIEEFQSDDKNKFVFRARKLLAGEGNE